MEISVSSTPIPCSYMITCSTTPYRDYTTALHQTSQRVVMWICIYITLHLRNGI